MSRMLAELWTVTVSPKDVQPPLIRAENPVHSVLMYTLAFATSGREVRIYSPVLTSTGGQTGTSSHALLPSAQTQRPSPGTRTLP